MAVDIHLTGGARNAHQDFVVNLGDRALTFNLDWCGYAKYPFWNCDIFENGEPVVVGLVLKCGCDLLSPYQLGIGKLVMTGEEPTLENLGQTNTLTWIAENEEI